MEYADDPAKPPRDLGDETDPAGAYDRLSRRALGAAQRVRGGVERAVGLGREAVQDAGERAQRIWMPEDPEVILGSPAFAPFPARHPVAELLSTSWRTDALLGLSALGVSVCEREIITVTRAVFHDGLPHQELSRRLFGADCDAIHRWMDTVPGSGIRGGGILHRLQHGHDFAAVQQLYEQHGLPGVLVWMQHLAQDVATPTGIPTPSVDRSSAHGWSRRGTRPQEKRR